ncbi:hypothetical protein ACIPY5_19615 [Microbacterium sp. NPDC089698]|jgi:hypothetical protein|uniref:hypothetical protein n=1 Tax=unclassified Microbacterium TaxID=2609290 RepID=UPI00282F592E|nr:hypothetical protein [Microbacterium sp.]MDR2321431.1 antibiotic biosynthesis monooxygenase [Microbacterium sp.]
MIRSVLTLRPAPANVDAILSLYRRESILQESLDLTRAVASEIATAVDGSGEIIVTAVWPDEAAYQEWLDHPNRGRTGPELAALLGTAVTAGRLYAIDHAAPENVR